MTHTPVTFRLRPGKAYALDPYDPDKALREQPRRLVTIGPAVCRRTWYTGTQGSLPDDPGTFIAFRDGVGGPLYLQGQPRTCFACGIEVTVKTYCRTCYTHHCARCGQRKPRGAHGPEAHQ